MVEDFRVSLRNFPKMKGKFFETTLIDNLQWIPSNCYDNLYDAFTIRCHVFDHLRGTYEPFKMEKFEPAVTSTDDKELGYRDWIDFTYSGKEDPSENPMLHIQNEDQSSAAKQTEQRNLPIAVAQPAQPALPGGNKKADIERWVKQISKAEPKTRVSLSGDNLKEPNELGDRSGKEPVKSKFFVRFQHLTHDDECR